MRMCKTCHFSSVFDHGVLCSEDPEEVTRGAKSVGNARLSEWRCLSSTGWFPKSHGSRPSLPCSSSYQGPGCVPDCLPTNPVVWTRLRFTFLIELAGVGPGAQALYKSSSRLFQRPRYWGKKSLSHLFASCYLCNSRELFISASLGSPWPHTSDNHLHIYIQSLLKPNNLKPFQGL